jgi:acyl-CoA thioesterase-1
MKHKYTYDVKIQYYKPYWLSINTFIFICLSLFAFMVDAFGQESEVKNTKNVELEGKSVLILGDSLSAGYGLPPGESFPDKLQIWLNLNHHNVTIINAGVSGDTSQGGRSRLEWVYSSIPNGGPDLVVIEFGGNDVLRGFEPKITQKNIEAMVMFLKNKKTKVLLTGMQSPPNMGSNYAQEFNAIYPNLAQKHNIPFYPFFLEGVGGVPSLNQKDGIHPNEEGVKVIVNKIGPYVVDLLFGK